MSRLAPDEEMKIRTKEDRKNRHACSFFRVFCYLIIIFSFLVSDMGISRIVSPSADKEKKIRMKGVNKNE